MTLRQKQSKLVHMVALLILHAEQLGYELTFGDAYRDRRAPYGNKNSLHKKRLAVDFNLFKNGRYVKSTRAHKPLGEYWESIGGTWGGRFGESEPGAGNGRDGNHYSLEHGGVR